MAAALSDALRAWLASAASATAELMVEVLLASEQDGEAFRSGTFSSGELAPPGAARRLGSSIGASSSELFRRSILLSAEEAAGASADCAGFEATSGEDGSAVQLCTASFMAAAESAAAAPI